MELQKNTLLKIIIFLLVGFIFIVAVVAYSNARSGRGGRIVEDFYGDFDGRHLKDEEGWIYRDSDETDRRMEKTFDVRPGGALHLDTDNGSIVVGTWDKPQVVVTVEMSGDAKILRRYSLKMDADDSTVTIIGKHKRSRFFPWHWQSSDIHFQVKVPNIFQAKVSTAGGDVEINGLEGKVRCETSGGDVRLTSLNGNVYGETSGGDIVIRRVIGNLEAHTSGGNVEVDSVVGPVKVGTSGGEVILLNINGKVFGETSGGNIEARLLGENKGVQLETSGGNVSVYVPKGFTGDLDASTSGGSVECDLPIMVTGKVRESELHGKMNGGGSVIQLSTSGGNIYIRIRE